MFIVELIPLQCMQTGWNMAGIANGPSTNCNLKLIIPSAFGCILHETSWIKMVQLKKKKKIE